MSSKLIRYCCLALFLLPAAFASAQNSSGEGPRGLSAEEALAEANNAYGPPPPVEDCPDTDLPSTENVIVVCRRRVDQSQHRIRSDEQAENDYAEATKFANDPQAPDVAGPGIFRGKPTFSLPPPVPAILIDIKALPEAPPGSDADRIARGLAPRGNEGGNGSEPRDEERPQ